MQAALTTSGFTGVRVAARPARIAHASARSQVAVRAASSGYQWLNKDPVALMLGFGGWFVPSNIPVGAFGGKSLFGLLMGSIGEELSHFPAGPAVTDSFWLYLITWHVGLFICLTFAQIGVQGSKQGYFPRN